MATIKKPTFNAEEALSFATGGDKPKAKKAIAKPKKVAKKAPGKADSKSGLIPEGDVRLTANMRGDLHMKLKMKSVQERTTIGELLETLVDKYLDKV